ncbi:endonuclease/exonuclease/phosphatase family protein [uncultured Phenylobacterium sp.]|uniref:endonuclease/exonuclease/phosphatase family protein n=1 Tax=uncultured Phenylobacterium sp. TaxID=349273 RepID=UPI0025FCBE0F|nr:endonuclease/exonuclease/phosphatase family protein [uncultured Phenylobacterium sp.]
MPFYQDIKHDEATYPPGEREYIASRLLDLRQVLEARIPERELRRTLVLGTWNIRDFDDNKFGQGPRRRESLHYIAEVLARFDICAVQEINDKLKPLKDVVKLMGPSYEFMATDVTMGTSGNNERLAFIYDTRKVQFRNVVGELVLPATRQGETRQIARTPLVASFQAGWFKFTICTAHIYYGKDSRTSPEYARRVNEIATIAGILAKRAKEEGENYIFLGDFNVIDREDATFKALADAGFFVPDELQGSNMAGDRSYDQIAFQGKKDELIALSAGVFDYRLAVFRDEDFVRYKAGLPQKSESGAPLDLSTDEKRLAHYRKWRTWQISDHLPLWVQFEVDFSDAYLEGIAKGA